MNKLVKDALVLTAITLIAGVCLGGVYEITKGSDRKRHRSLQLRSLTRLYLQMLLPLKIWKDLMLTQQQRSLLMQVIQMMILQIAWLQKMMQGRRSVMSSRSHLMPDMAETSHSLWV